ncbi:MAG: hypothetical protein FWG38_10600 [Defluviitaleaceae bacterium]|nr:hypothetical protein [Defluviitaleaceae bacterium]
MKTLRKRLLYFITAALYALGYFTVSQTIFWGVAGENILAAAFWNVGFILFAIVLDKAETLLYTKLIAKYQARPNLLTRLVKAYLGGVSFKSALYLFYIVILVLSIIGRAQPEQFYEGFHAYLISVESGILVLFAADQFFKQLFADSDREDAPTQP